MPQRHARRECFSIAPAAETGNIANTYTYYPSILPDETICSDSHSCGTGRCGLRQPPPCGAGKPKYLWFDATANFERFAVRDSVDLYLDKACRAGFNRIVVDVRPVEGDVLYNSDLLPRLKPSTALPSTATGTIYATSSTPPTAAA